jgi:hypothetical protein
MKMEISRQMPHKKIKKIKLYSFEVHCQNQYNSR